MYQEFTYSTKPSTQPPREYLPLPLIWLLIMLDLLLSRECFPHVGFYGLHIEAAEG